MIMFTLLSAIDPAALSKFTPGGPSRSFALLPSSHPSACNAMAHLNFGVLIKLIKIFPASPELSLP
jgi:hypothetical protein